MKFDLHCHSNASDGKLPPSEVLARAAAAELSLFALTDHDTIAGYEEVAEQTHPFTLISGIELSSVWSGVSVHIIGLDFDPKHPAILQAIDGLRHAREVRAHMLDKKLAARGMPNTLQGALQFCPDIGQVGRPHFAEYMVQQGYVQSANKAFDLWLGSGKIGDIKTEWPTMESCVKSIVEAQGVAVLAHPLRYKLTFTKLRRLIDTFAEAGGEAVEVACAQSPGNLQQALCQYVAKSDLAGSGGSDFHSPDWHWAQIGRIDPIPKAIQPVWGRFKRTKVV